MYREFPIHTSSLDEIPVRVDFDATPARRARRSFSCDYSRDEAPEPASVRIQSWSIDSSKAPEAAAEFEILRVGPSSDALLTEAEERICDYIVAHLADFIAEEEPWAVAA